MIHPGAMTTIRRGLPQLRGRPLWAYRALWLLSTLATLVALASTLSAGDMQPLVLGIRLVKSAILVAVATILFWKRPRDPVAAILALAFLCWTITSSVDFTSAQLWPMLLDRLRFLLFAFALLLFPDGKWRPRWTRKVALASTIVFAIGAVEVVGLLSTHVFLPLAITCVLAAVLTLILRFRRTSSETQQQQLKWVSFGLGTGVSLILSARAGAALFGPAIVFEALFQLGIVLVALGFLVPLLRYRLYDAEAVISRSVGYAVLTATLVATFAGSEALIELLGQQYLGSGIGQVSGAIAAALAAVLLAPLSERISGWAEEHFQQDLVQLKRRLPALLAEIPHSWTPRQIGDAALSHITEAIHAKSCAILLQRTAIAAKDLPLRQVGRSMDKFVLRLPLHSQFGDLGGVLLIGPRPDGSAYGKDELKTVKATLSPLSAALLAALEREKIRLHAQNIQRDVAKRLGQMSARLDAIEQASGSQCVQRTSTSKMI